jgi:hypothetical protein
LPFPFELIYTNRLLSIHAPFHTGFIEMPLAYQLLNDERFAKLVDQFYFENHVQQVELAPAWTSTMEGSIKASLDLFAGLRQKGIASHYWV